MARPRLKAKTYMKELRRLQAELCHLQEWVKATGQRIIVVFEGRDAAGKGGTIRAITERVSPRVFRVVALPAPSDREKSQMYIQRYLAHFPAAGEIVIFDRSWYNRAGVEYVLGFCTKEQRRRFLEICPLFEKQIVDSGIRLIKYWLEVGPGEQKRRFQARIEDPLRQWKLSPIDLESRRRWYDYSHARDEMFEATDTKFAPWHIVQLRRQEAGAPELHRALPGPDPLRAGAATEDQDGEPLAQGCLRRRRSDEEAPLRPEHLLSHGPNVSQRSGSGRPSLSSCRPGRPCRRRSSWSDRRPAPPACPDWRRRPRSSSVKFLLSFQSMYQSSSTATSLDVTSGPKAPGWSARNL